MLNVSVSPGESRIDVHAPGSVGLDEGTGNAHDEGAGDMHVRRHGSFAGPGDTVGGPGDGTGNECKGTRTICTCTYVGSSGDSEETVNELGMFIGVTEWVGEKPW